MNLSTLFRFPWFAHLERVYQVASRILTRNYVSTFLQKIPWPLKAATFRHRFRYYNLKEPPPHFAWTPVCRVASPSCLTFAASTVGTFPASGTECSRSAAFSAHHRLFAMSSSISIVRYLIVISLINAGFPAWRGTFSHCWLQSYINNITLSSIILHIGKITYLARNVKHLLTNTEK